MDAHSDEVTGTSSSFSPLARSTTTGSQIPVSVSTDTRVDIISTTVPTGDGTTNFKPDIGGTIGG
ncbi:hypothetical protein V5O48_010453, partial [Marasmius crinis-equi]